MRIACWRGAAVLGALFTLAVGASADLIKAGKAAPAWSGKTIAGKPISSSQYKGKVMLLNFFSYT